MTTDRGTVRTDVTRWLVCGLVILLAHAGLALALTREMPIDEVAETSGAFVIELAPMAAARQDLPKDVAPGPDQIQADAAPTRIEKVDEKREEVPLEPPAPAPAASLLMPLPRRDELPEVQPEPQTAVPVTTAAQAEADKAVPVAVAPVAGAPGATDVRALQNWQTKIVTSLERNKRYPSSAQARNEQGTVHVAFSIDRHGRLLSSRIVTSSGSATLDAEARELLRRAEPFPAPPPELPGAELSLAVPIRFNFR